MKLIQGKYLFSGLIDPLELIKKYGSPLYVYDGAIIERQFRSMEKAFSGVSKLKISYACKALTNINILRFLRSLGSGIDCVSLQEVQLSLKAGFVAEDIIFTPSGVSKEELTSVAEYGVSINVDNIDALEFLGRNYPDLPLSLRIKPNIMAGGNAKISVGHEDSKFGIPLSKLNEVLELVQKLDITIEGIHIHTGSDIYDLDIFKRGAQVVFEVAKKFDTLEFIDFGGGFKVPYKEGDKSVDMAELGPQIVELFNNFCDEYGKELKLIFEPGKYLVSQCGYLLVPVNVVKDGGYRTFVHVDSGLNHLLRPMMYDAYHHIVNLSNPEGEEKRYDVVGYICETDTFASDRMLPIVKEGDILAIFNAGAYSFTMSSNYNSRLRPPEVLIMDGKDYLIREREDFEYLLQKQIEIPELKPVTLNQHT